MDAKDFADLRQRCGMTQAAAAGALGVTPRTISGWEGAERERSFSGIEARAIRDLFISDLLGDRLGEMAEQAYRKIPSEFVAIWLVHGSECIVLPEAVRLQQIGAGKRREVRSARTVVPLSEKSLTTYPLRTGESVNLAGDRIGDSPDKKYKGRWGIQYQDGVCESLLHVPAFTPSAFGPRPVLMLSFENKLDENGRVIEGKGGQTPVYTPEDLAAATDLARKFRDELLPDLNLLGMRE
jgi:hypothetical protein